MRDVPPRRRGDNRDRGPRIDVRRPCHPYRVRWDRRGVRERIPPDRGGKRGCQRRLRPDLLPRRGTGTPTRRPEMIDGFYTVAASTSARISRKKSRFLAFLAPVSSAADIDREQERLRRAYHDATHRPFAYRLLDDKGEIISRADDDGEPAGSAGVPILRRIEGSELINVMIAVVRYFGGTKLGIGGLARAYSDAAAAAISEARIVERQIESRVSVRFPPELTSAVMGTLHRYGANLEGIEYDRQARAAITIMRSRAEGFIAALRDATGGRAEVKEEG
ncbi:hypothetical protein DRJ24_00455 [Candidatus Acetothermia bacterium]|nr:MAG: hypothetical protein DRJ24_00455 [Candidatus Acetothermia bacterium]